MCDTAHALQLVQAPLLSLNRSIDTLENGDTMKDMRNSHALTN